MLRMLFLFSTLSLIASAEDFYAYLPSPTGQGLQMFAGHEVDGKLQLTEDKRITLGFAANVAAVHPRLRLIYVGSRDGAEDAVPGAVLSVDQNGRFSGHENITVNHGYCFMSLDRTNQYLLGVDYFGGHVDVFSLNASGLPTRRVAALDEGRKNAHCVWTSPDNQYVYVPYVKDTNGLFQYRFDVRNGSLSPLTPRNAEPPAGTGPRHLTYHPTLPVLYFSNEQHLGVSVYRADKNGQLKVIQICDAVDNTQSKEGVSSSDILISQDGRFLFAGIRGHKQDFDWISRYQILDDGRIRLLGLTKADKIPWGFTLTPDGRYLLATAFEGGTLTAWKIESDGNLTKAASVKCDKRVMDVVTMGAGK